MAKRRILSQRLSKKIFRKGNRVKGTNLKSAPMRGGIRL